jgi:hypothetical protein
MFTGGANIHRGTRKMNALFRAQSGQKVCQASSPKSLSRCQVLEVAYDHFVHEYTSAKAATRGEEMVW